MSAPQYSTAWGTALLKQLGYPVTSYNLAFLAAWANREGTKARYNPLATTLAYGGGKSRPGNSAGVKDYTSLAEGVAATAKTLLNGRYSDILIALKTGVADPKAHYQGLYTWSGHGYDNLAGIPTTVSGGTGGNAGAGAAGVPPKASSKGQTPADYAAQVGWSIAVINSDPSLKNLFAQAEAGNWNAARWQAAVKNTTWYRRQNDAQRAWYILSREDPKTAADRITQRMGQIETTADQLGVGISKDTARQLALSSISLGYNDQQIRYMIGQSFSYDPTKAGYGLAGTAEDAIKKAAADFAIPVSDAAIGDWTKNIVDNARTPDDFTDYARNLAKQTYGKAVGDAIDAGMTVRQYVDPYAQLAVQNGVAADAGAIDWTDPKWNQVLKPTDPTSGAGAAQPLSLDAATRLYRTDTRFGYDQSGVAMQSSAQLTQALGQRLGAIG